MILDELVLHNYGVFAGRHAIELTPAGAQTPIILFGGTNGAGKTTLLEALQVALFGARASCIRQTSGGYPSMLKSKISLSAPERQAALSISFRHFAERTEQRFKVNRTWDRNGREIVDVYENGKRSSALSQNWTQKAEDLFPVAVSPLFFFDGEQAEGYASPDKSSHLIQTAIQGLLGVDIVEQLCRDLKTLEKRVIVRNKGNAVMKDGIDHLEAKIHETEKELIAASNHVSELISRDLFAKMSDLEQVRQELDKRGGGLYEQKVQVEQRLQASEVALDLCKKELLDVVDGDLPLMLVHDLLSDLAAQASADSGQKLRKRYESQLAQRDAEMIELLKTLATPVSTIEQIQAFFQRSNTPILTHDGAGSDRNVQNDSVSTVIQGLLDGGLARIVRRAKSLSIEYRDKLIDCENCRYEVAGIPQIEEISDSLKEKEKLKQQIDELEQNIATARAEKNDIESRLRLYKEELDRLLVSAAYDKLEAEEDQRIVLYSSMSRSTLGQFSQDIIQMHIHNIERLVLECFTTLLHKNTLVSRIAIDAGDFTVRLFDDSGHYIDADTLSAGERQLLAVSLLWGMARSSGCRLPTAIDTPLGRLDAQHRLNLTEYYFPFASHQVLIFSTDEEIIGQQLAKLKKWVGREYLLAYDDSTASTAVQKGYFTN